MTNQDRIAELRETYRTSLRTKADWVHYCAAKTALGRMEHTDQGGMP